MGPSCAAGAEYGDYGVLGEKDLKNYKHSDVAGLRSPLNQLDLLQEGQQPVAIIGSENCEDPGPVKKATVSNRKVTSFIELK